MVSFLSPGFGVYNRKHLLDFILDFGCLISRRKHSDSGYGNYKRARG